MAQASPGLTWVERVALVAYDGVVQALQPLLRRKLQRRGREEAGYLHAIEERFGRYTQAPTAGGYVWVHAVSLGETRAAAVLLDRKSVV